MNDLDRVESLLQKHLDGQATPEEYQELADHLAHDSEARQRYAAYLQLHALLAWEGKAAGLPETTCTQRWFGLSWKSAVIAATLLIALGSLLVWWKIRQQVSNKKPYPVAKLTRFPAGSWMNGQGPRVGEDVFPGTYVLLEGNAELALTSGGKVIVEAPAQMQMHQDDRLVLDRGSVVARRIAAGKGFTFQTAGATIRESAFDLGIAVASTGKTIVQVFEGEATIQLTGLGKGLYNVNAGKAVEIDKPTNTLREVPFSGQRFVRELPNRGERAYTWLPPYNRSRHRVMSVVPAPRHLTIDGDLHEWEPATAITARLQEPFSQSFYFSGQLMHDEHFLYVAAHVGDPAPMRNVMDPEVNPEAVWKGGGVQLRLSTSPELGWPLQGRSPIGAPRSQPEIGHRPEDVSHHLVHLTLWYYRPEQRPCLVLHYGMDYQHRVVNPQGWRGAFRRDAGGRGYVLEYAIPWNLLNAARRPPRAGDVLGASWQVHWSDQGGRLWRGHLIELTRPDVEGLPFLRASKWGKAIYR